MNYFSDLYIEENEKFDSILSAFKLAGWEVIVDEMGPDRNYVSIYSKGKGNVDIYIVRKEKLMLEYSIWGVNRSKVSSQGGDNVELMIERVLSVF